MGIVNPKREGRTYDRARDRSVSAAAAAVGEPACGAPARSAAWWWPAGVALAAALVTHVVTLWGTYIYDDVFIALRDPRLHDVGRWGQYWTQSWFPNSPSRL